MRLFRTPLLAAAFAATTTAALGCRTKSSDPALTQTVVIPGGSITADASGEHARIVSAHGTVDGTDDGVQTITFPGSDRLMVIAVTGDRLRRTFACDSTGVTVTGNDDDVTLTGKCEIVNVLGDRNRVTVAASRVIQAPGVHNTVHYAAGVDSTAPMLANVNAQSTVTRSAP